MPRTPGRVSKVNTGTLLLPFNADCKVIGAWSTFFTCCVLPCSHQLCDFHPIVVNLNTLIGLLEFDFRFECSFGYNCT